jgi:hypothetical protein
VLGVNPEGVVDPELGVLQDVDAHRAIRATLVNFACHPAILSPKNRQIPAEWPGVMRREVQVFRIGDLALVAHAAETFTEIGQAIKQGSPAPHTLFAGYSTGCVGYLPTAEAHAEGGYEVEEAPLAYRVSGTFDPGCAAVATERSIQMVASLWGRC